VIKSHAVFPAGDSGSIPVDITLPGVPTVIQNLATDVAYGCRLPEF